MNAPKPPTRLDDARRLARHALTEAKSGTGDRDYPYLLGVVESALEYLLDTLDARGRCRVNAELGTCWTCCEHGGMCELRAGHDGLHDSRYCKWSDAEAVTKEAADAELTRKGGGAIVALTDTLMAVADLFDEDGAR